MTSDPSKTPARWCPQSLRLWALALLCSSVLTPFAHATTTDVVVTDAGAVQGIVRNGAIAFLGLPFAAPPLGPQRWQPPAPVTRWSGVRPATTLRQACKQDGQVPPAGVAQSDEDCLYLNVYTPSADVASRAPLPVMVWLHGGAFVTGAGSQYDGSALAQKAQAIVVTVNYRLGMFGFLALDSAAAENPAGNAGLLDQQAALGWVNRNIAHFGGDAHRVTLFGESAGGASVCQQLVSPGAAHLFHRAIIQSGPCTFETATRAQAKTIADAFAQKLGCAADAGQMACLRSKSTDEVMAASPIMDFHDPRSLKAVRPWVDGVVLTDMPMNLIKKGQFNHVPVIMGGNQDEGRLFVALGYDRPPASPLTETAYQATVAHIAGNATAGYMVTLDYSSQRLGSPNLASAAIMTDSMFACPTQAYTRALASQTPTYAYEFQEDEIPPLFADPYMPWGAFHASELPFIFQSRIDTNPPSPDPHAVATRAQLVLSDQMVQYWARFAATGNPNGDSRAPYWPRFTGLLKAMQQFKSSGITTDLGGGLYRKHQCLLWDSAAVLGLGL